jgi:hypothetical protein
MLGWLQFERFLFEVACVSFGETIPLDSKVRMLMLQAKPYVETQYGVVLVIDRRPSKLSESKLSLSSKQIDFNISAAMQAAKTLAQNSFSLSPSKFQSPERTPRNAADYKSREAGRKFSETDRKSTERSQSPSRIVRTAVRSLSSTSLSDLSVVQSASFAADKVKVRLKNPFRRSTGVSLLERHRSFIEKSQLKNFSTVSST